MRARIAHDRSVASGTTNGGVTSDDAMENASFPLLSQVERLTLVREKIRMENRGQRALIEYRVPAQASMDDLSWEDNHQQNIRSSLQLIQRVGRGYLLRSFNPERTCHSDGNGVSLHRSRVGEHGVTEDDSDKRCVSFIGGPSTFQLDTSGPRGQHRTKALRSIYALSHLSSDELEGMIEATKKEHTRDMWKRLSNPRASRMQRSASTLFLASPEETTAVRKPSEREKIRQQLMQVDIEMKKRIAFLDKQTRDAQRVQDLKMLQLAKEDALVRERQRQLNAVAREQLRAARQKQREEEKAREQDAIIERKALHREYDIKRAELHVELRQRYMLEDRVTALRTTLSELSNVSHLSACVPSLNLTQAMKEAHFRAEGLDSPQQRGAVLDDP